MIEKSLTAPLAAALLIALTFSCSSSNGKDDAHDTGEVQTDDPGIDDPGIDDPGIEETSDIPETPDDPDAEEISSDAEAEEIDEEEIPCPSFSEVQPIFTSHCTGCHLGYDNYSVIVSNIDAIRSMVSMFHYIGGPDREQVLRWIDCGTPE